MTTEPQHEPRPTTRTSGHAKRPPSSLAGLKPFLLAGLLVVIGLLVGLNFLLGGPGESPPNAEPMPGAITIGPPPGPAPPGLKAPPATAPAAPSSSAAPGSTPSGRPPAAPSEFTFYETLKKPPHDPAATVGLTQPKAPANAAPQKSPAKAPAKAAPPKSAAKTGPSKSIAAESKPAPAGSGVIETTTAEKGSLHYTVQVGAFRQQSVAEQMIRTLNKKGHDAYLATASSPDGVTYRVRVGRFTTREAADRAANQLAATEKLHPFVATVNPDASKKS